MSSCETNESRCENFLTQRGTHPIGKSNELHTELFSVQRQMLKALMNVSVHQIVPLCVCLCHVELLIATEVLFSEFVFSNLKQTSLQFSW